MTRTPPQRYLIQKLNDHSDTSWAVVESPSGSIAQDKSGKLIMRLAKADATEIAAAMSIELQDPGSEAQPNKIAV